MKCHLILSAALLLAASRPVVAQESQDDEAKAWQQRRQAEFAEYELTQIAPTGEMSIKLEAGSLLSWSNPIRKTAAGAVYLWTLDGRPQMIASTYPFPEGIEQELQSLSEHPIVARQAGQIAHRFAAGIEWKKLPDADPPVPSRSLRLTQMRRLAERFRVTGGKEESFDARMLTKPIYRTPADHMSDIGLFVFVQGTDPEAVLMLEAVNETGWRFAFARMTRIPIRADYNDSRVWNLPATWEVSTDDKTAFHVVQLPGAR